MNKPKHTDVAIHGIAEVMSSESPLNSLFPMFDPKTGKPYLILMFKYTDEPPSFTCLTTNLAELIGGIAKGTREGFENRNKK